MPSATTRIMATFPDATADKKSETPVRRWALSRTTSEIRLCSSSAEGLLLVPYHFPLGSPSGNFAACHAQQAPFSFRGEA